MTYQSLNNCVLDLQKHGKLVRVTEPISPNQELAAVLRQIYRAQGPAVLFTNVEGTRYPVLGNLFGTLERARFIFRHTLERARLLIDLRAKPEEVLKNPRRLLSLPKAAWTLLPKKKASGPVLHHEITLSEIPQVVSWPEDGGPFVTLPQVYTENIMQPGWKRSNLGMYRVQLAGNDYVTNKEVGLHYQIHRGIGVHHQLAKEKSVNLRVAVFIGGPPALAVSAVMPLPENLPELSFAGVLGGRRVPLIPMGPGMHLHANADFCIVGRLSDMRKPEGPFGDHLGYYSLKHDFPVLKVERVFCREDAIYPVTTVGRPPQEDSTFGALIHEITGPMIPAVLPGVLSIQAVDETGVHPLLLAVGSERYVPHESGNEEPQEILTQANAILGQGQLSLAKYLFILNGADAPEISANDTRAFFTAVLQRFNPMRDLHFQTQTTMDTLDYSGGALNKGSKLVIAARGKPKRELKSEIPSSLTLPEGFHSPKVVIPGVLAVAGPKWRAGELSSEECSGLTHISQSGDIPRLVAYYKERSDLGGFPLLVIVDDSEFAARDFGNFLWVTFTRSNPAVDIHGLKAVLRDKHWGCETLVIDARVKDHHAPALTEDPKVINRIGRFFKNGGELEKWA